MKNMTKTSMALFLMSVFIINSLYSQNMESKKDNYKAEWAKVDSLNGKGLPKSALEEVEKILLKAKSEKNADQFIKASIYRMKFVNYSEESAFEKLINDAQKSADTGPFPVNAMMHSICADLYFSYYKNNYWKFQNRTNTVNFVTDDIKTWDLQKFAEKMTHHHIKALENADSLKQFPIDYFTESLIRGIAPHNLRPTLYDFLANKAIDFFTNSDLALTEPVNKFELAEDLYFWDAEKFVNEKILTKDSSSLRFYAVTLLQNLIKFRLADTKNVDALIDIDLRRLQFVNTYSTNPNKDKLYLDQLVQMELKYAAIPFSSEISFKIAEFYYKKGNTFNPLKPETKNYKWSLKTAHGICKKTTDKFPGSTGSAKCDYLLKIIENKQVYFDMEEIILPFEKNAIRISYKNLSKVYIRLATINPKRIEKIMRKEYDEEKLYDAFKKASHEVYKQETNLPVDGDFNMHSAEALINSLPLDYYMICISSDPEFTYKKNTVAYQFFRTSNISFIKRKVEDGSFEFHVLNRKTGAPMKDVIAQAYIEKYSYTKSRYIKRKQGVYISDHQGYFKVPAINGKDEKYMSVEFRKGEDFLPETKFYLNYYRQVEHSNYSVTFFTDRAIYRPGQTVYFKGIVINHSGDKNEIVPNHNSTITLYDVNHQKVSDLSVVSNEYGTFNGSFVIPTGLLNGQMEIRTSNGSKYILVEEYKRPKFEVSMLPFEGNYKLNDDVTVKGKAITYAGSNLTDAMVTYRVVRKPVWRGWWYWAIPGDEREIAHGKVQTGDNGEFKITFKAIPDLSLQADDNLVFNYFITADVTDINGETQGISKNMVVGWKGLQVAVDFPNLVNKNKLEKVDISTKNLNGEFLASKGQIAVFKLKEPDFAYRTRLYQQPDTFIYANDEWKKLYPGNLYKDENNIYTLEKSNKVLDVGFDTEKDKTLALNDLKNWEAGRYVCEISSKDGFDQPVSYKNYFTVYSENEAKVPAQLIDWFVSLTPTCEPGEKAQFLIGSALENVNVVYEIEHKGKQVSKQWIVLDRNQKLIEIPVKEEYRGNFSVHFTFIKNCRIYNHDETVFVPYTNKELDFEFATFHNKLYPGQQEEWMLKIKDKKGDKVAAEMLATLYDASLDVFAKNYFYLNIWASHYSTLNWNTETFSISGSTQVSRDFNPYTYYPSWYYDYLNWFGFYYYSYNYNPNVYYDTPKLSIRGSKSDSYKRKASGLFKKSEADDGIRAFDADFSSNEPPPPPAPGKIEKQVVFSVPQVVETEGNEQTISDKNLNLGEKVQIRKNFNETAFFFPDLLTNEKGEVIIKFTIPEALTKWRFMGFAHTKDLQYGTCQNDAITQKDLMIMPNLPRFFREGDKIEFSVKVSNISDKELNGTISLELMDAFTMKPLENIFSKGEPVSKSFSVKARQNASVSWSLNIPDASVPVSYRLIAKAGNFSDGEEGVIPVLSNRMLVTESLPLPIRSKQTKNFEFTKLINSGSSTTLKQHKLTLEFSSQPAWYAIQALPYIMEYPYECAEQVFSRFYANSIASYIANSSPKIKAVFDSWKSDKESLLSNLEKNQELKSVLLQETPWVLDAKNETERKHRVGVLFDLNRMNYELEGALKKLIKFQVSNGAWPWFPGMRESRYITQHVVCGMGHLDALGVKNVRTEPRTWKMVTKAIDYLDDVIIDDYRYLKRYYNEKEMQENHLSDIAIHYLYGRSYFKDIEIPSKTKEAFEYYMGQMKKYWLPQSIYSQGMIALALNRYGEKQVPADIIKSLTERSQTSEEMGMYWKDNISGWYWYQMPIETHSLLIEVYDEVANDSVKVDNLKVWLLKQKQTTDWKTTKATVEAIYALLHRGASWLASDKLVKINLGGMEIDPKNLPDVKVEAGTGYFKTSWSGSEIKPEMGKIRISKEDAGVAWGALYWQYFENLDKITPHETPLKLNKKLFIEVITDQGKTIEPIDKRNIKPGDKIIVRIELRTDRDMEYVHMKDMRASGFEPINVISAYKYQGGIGYYEETKDAATNFFMDYLRKGTYVFEYPLRVSQIGDFSNGITTIQCMYAPEFTSHSEGIRVKVEK